MSPMLWWGLAALPLRYLSVMRCQFLKAYKGCIPEGVLWERVEELHWVPPPRPRWGTIKMHQSVPNPTPSCHETGAAGARPNERSA